MTHTPAADTPTRPRPASAAASSTPRRAGAELARAAAALAALTVAVGGVPVGLAALSAPLLPHTAPTLGDLSRLLMARDSGQLLEAALLVVAWVGWLAFTASVTIEAAAQLRGRRPPRLPAAGPAQDLAARLVATIALAVTGSTLTLLPTALPANAATTATATSSTATTAPLHVSPVTRAASAPSAPPPAAVAPATGNPRQKVYVVQGAGHRDSLWAIAAVHLGDPLRWHEIAALNAGRTQPDGGRLRDPHWIRPGWRLLMPADATGVTTLSQLAAATPSASGPTPTPAATAPPRQQPAAPAPKAAPAPAKTAPSRPVTASPIPTATAEPRRQPPPAPDRKLPPVARPQPASDRLPVEPLPLVGGGLLAAGVLAALARLRAIQRRHRPDGHRLTPPAPQVAAGEVRLRVAAEPEDRQFLELALRTLTAALAAQPSHPAGLPAPVGARLTGDGLELFLATGSPVPRAPLIPAGQAGGWLLPRQPPDPTGEQQTGRALALLPALVPIGHDQAGLVLLDLEAAGTIALTGPADLAAGVLARIAAELAVASWADAVQATLIGFGQDLCQLEPDRLTYLPALDEPLLRRLERHVENLEQDISGRDAVLAGRLDPDRDPIMPEIFLLARPPDEAMSQRLGRLAGDGRRTGIAIVVAGDWSAATCQLPLDYAGRLHVPPLQVTVQAATLTDAALQVIGDLLDHARADTTTFPAPAGLAAMQPAVFEPTLRSQPPDTSAALVTVGADAPEAADEPDDRDDRDDRDERDGLDRAVARFWSGAGPAVSVMGPIAVRAGGPIESKRVVMFTELVVYVAVHGRRVAQLHRLDEAIWPEHEVRAATRTEALARARRWLGTDEQDNQYLSLSNGDALTLSDGVLVDWELFQRLVTRGRDADLRQALRLVRGRPFEGIPKGRYGWLAELYLEQDIPVAVVDAAHTLAARCLERGDHDGARDAARTAQLIDRFDERPWRDRIQAEHALGNHGVVLRLVGEMRALLDNDLDDGLTAETEQLLARVAPRRAPKAG